MERPDESYQPVAPSYHRRRRTTLKKKVWIGIVVLSVIITLSILMIVQSRHTVIDRAITKEATFPVYVPKRLPTAYDVKPSETKLGNGALTYTLAAHDTQAEIVITVQPLPENFNMTKLIGNGSISATTTKNGTLYDLSVAGNGQYLLNTGDALVFFRSSKEIDAETIHSLAENLTKQ